MPNPFKRIKKTLRNMLGGKREPVQVDPKLYPQLEVIWPSGTWKYPGKPNTDSTDWDVQVIQPTILDCWAQEFYDDAVARAGYELNPGMFGSYPPPIPDDWLPSEKALKKLYDKNKWNLNYLHYVVGQLQHLGHIRP